MKTLFVLLSFVGICSCSSKQWQRDVNFNNPSNWDSGKLPCATNRIVFPDRVNTVLLQTNISSVKEIILPRNGNIVMQNGMTLSFSDTASDADCDGGDVNFVRPDSESWFDPDNWQDLENLVSVETERVPCSYDSVRFPANKLFSVGLDDSVDIGKMSFSGKEYNTDKFETFMISDPGKLQFERSNSAAVTIKDIECPQTSGCSCGNDDPAILNKICSLYTCLAISCDEAVTPIGGCCPLCGAILTMEYDAGTFNLATFSNKIHDNYHVHDTNVATNRRRRRREVDTGQVDTYTSKTSTGHIQLVLTDKERGNAAITLAQEIMTDIQNDPALFGITDVQMQSSKKGSGGQTGLISGGGVAGIVIAILIVVIVLGTLGFIVMRRRSVFFSKDTPLNADMDMGPGIPAGFMEDIPGQPPAIYMQSFDNPVYNTPTAQENLYDDPTRVDVLTDVASGDSDDLKKSSKKSKKGKGLPPSVENLDRLDQHEGFDNPTYSVQRDSGLSVEVRLSADNEDDHDGVKGFSNVGFDMESNS